MISKLSRFRSLANADKAVVLAVAAILPVLRIGLRWFGFARMQAWLARRATAVMRQTPNADLENIAWLVNLTANNLPGQHSCLIRSMLLQTMLLQRGIECELRIGFKVASATFEAHAWVEYAGQPINEDADVGLRFNAFHGAVGSFLPR